jgi:hypothetical protein
VSETLHLKAEIDALCKAAGLEASDVAHVSMNADSRVVTFTVYSRPLRYDREAGGAIIDVLAFPFEYNDASPGVES